jgi:hypothetical protein
MILPDPLAAEISVAIMAQFHSARQMLEHLGIASAEHDVIDHESTL